MRSSLPAVAATLVAVALTACAVGGGRTSGADEGPGAGSEGDETGSMPWTPFDPPPAGADGGASSGASGSSGASSSGGSTSSGGSSGASTSSGGSSGGSTSSSGASTSSGSSSGGSTSSSSSSGASSSGASSSGGAGGACGVCDRVWVCNGFGDPWATQGVRCVNQRTTTALRCDGYFDQGGSVKLGTWTSTPTKLTLRYPMLGGGTKIVDCTP